MNKYHSGELSKESPNYPCLLNEVSDAPKSLFYYGEYSSSIFEKTLAVVGSRAVSMYGEWIINSIVKEVARFGITIVSGFMYGVDALAHKAALEAGGKTIAVMAGGLDCVFPKYQEDLYNDIASSGLVVSEFLGDDFGGKWMFARRNRIVAGLSAATLVVEAGEGSGSLITARFARRYKRRVLAIPANLNSKNSIGTIQLLREGAKMVTCAEDVLELYFDNPNNYRQRDKTAVNRRLLLGNLDDLSLRLIDLLTTEPLTSDELLSKAKESVPKVSKCLTSLILSSHICEKDGRYYVN